MAKKKLKLLKFSVFIGVLSGIGLKVFDFIRTRAFRCGIKEVRVCNVTDFLIDTAIWAVITTVALAIIVFGIRFLFRTGKKDIWKKLVLKKAAKQAKEKKKPKKKKEPKKEKLKEEELEETEGVIKI